MSYWIRYRKESTMPKKKLTLILEECPLHTESQALYLVDEDTGRIVELTPVHSCPSPRVKVKEWKVEVKE